MLCKDSKPVRLIECKIADAEISKGLKYLKERFPLCDAWQISLKGTKNYKTPDGIRVAPAIELLKNLV